MTKQNVKIGLAIASLCIISFYVIYTVLKPQVNYADLSPYVLLDASDVQLATQQSLRRNSLVAAFVVRNRYLTPV